MCVHGHTQVPVTGLGLLHAAEVLSESLNSLGITEGPHWKVAVGCAEFLVG